MNIDVLEDNMVGEVTVIPRVPFMFLEEIPVESYVECANTVPAVDFIDEKEGAMTVTLVQKPGKKKTAAKAEASTKSEVDLKVERLIDLKFEIDGMKSKVDEYEKLRKELVSLCDEIAAPGDPVSFEVENGSVQFSGKLSERKISDMPRVFELLGQETFLKVCKVTMTDLDKYLGKGEQDTCTTSGLTGARKISVVAKAAEAK